MTIPGLTKFEVDLERGTGTAERAPDWVATFEKERCGAFWKRVPRAGGEAYLAGHLESPLFPNGRLEVAIFTAKQPGSQKDMIWSPRREEKSEAPAQRTETATREEDGDDDIPF